MIEKDDWRLNSQAEYLSGEKLFYKKWKPSNPRNDHDHCEFCWDKFSNYPDTLNEGYTTEDNYYWICEKCFNDFKDMFKFQLVKEIEK